MSYLGAPLMSIDQTWATPVSVFEYIQEFLNIEFTLDAAATLESRKCLNFFSKEDDAFKQEWFGNVWLNPPFGKGGKLQREFIEKAIDECLYLGHCKMVACLIPARTDTKLFHQIIMKHARKIYFIEGRINFVKAGNTVENAGATFPSMLVIFRRPGMAQAKLPHLKSARKRSRQRREHKMDTLHIPTAIRRGNR